MPDVSQRVPTAAPRGSVLFTDYALAGWQVTWLKAAIIVAATLWIYSPAFYGQFLWDDFQYFTDNALLAEPGRLWKAWFVPGSYCEYYPLSQTVQWIQWEMWHQDTLGYHLTNVALHGVAALLVWRLLAKFGLRLAWLGGLIFAVHPMNVESVAWISELKNELSAIPFLLAMCAWIDYEETRAVRYYGASLALFLLAMLGKITMALFPLVILVYAWWKRGRIGTGDVLATVPFWAISLLAIAVGGSISGVYALSLPVFHSVLPNLPPPLGGVASRIALAGVAFAFYLGEFFLPVYSMPMYPQWTVNPPSLIQFLPWLVYVGGMYWFWRRRGDWGRHAILGVLFCAIFAAPILGFTTLSSMSHSWVMDHLFYLPMIGIIGLVVAAMEDLSHRLAIQLRPLGTGLVTMALVLLAFLSHAYAGAFANAETLWTYAIGRNPNAWLAYHWQGKELQKDGRLEEARADFETALAYRPDLSDAWRSLGDTLLQMGRVPEAIATYRQGLAIDPRFVPLHNNLGIVLAQRGQTDEALEHFRAAIRLRPQDADAYSNLGSTYFMTGKLPEAAAAYQEALKLNPRLAEAHNNLGMVLAREGHTPDALGHFAAAVAINPTFVNARVNLGGALAALGHIPEAVTQFEAVLQLDPGNATAQGALVQLRQPSQARAPTR